MWINILHAPKACPARVEPLCMTSKKKNLSDHDLPVLKSAGKFKIVLLVSEWNSEITNSMRDAAFKTLVKNGVKHDHISVYDVPGSFELPLAAEFFCESGSADAVICIGCVIQGETRHFEFISQAVANGISRVCLDYGIPVIFGVLTTDTYQQALERAGGKHGNKGVEAAVAALKMLGLMESIFRKKK
jgi:6,7-dimethyl-8-ribityllumazine synthase